jgi:hypothetical protein
VVAAYRQIIAAEAPRFLQAFAGRYDQGDVQKYLADQVEVFLTLNKLTPRGFYKAVAASGGWRILEFAFTETSLLGRLLAYVPEVDRLSVWGISCVLRRDREAVLRPGDFLRQRYRADLRGTTRRFVASVRAAVGRG